MQPSPVLADFTLHAWLATSSLWSLAAIPNIDVWTIFTPSTWRNWWKPAPLKAWSGRKGPLTATHSWLDGATPLLPMAIKFISSGAGSATTLTIFLSLTRQKISSKSSRSSQTLSLSLEEDPALASLEAVSSCSEASTKNTIMTCISLMSEEPSTESKNSLKRPIDSRTLLTKSNTLIVLSLLQTREGFTSIRDSFAKTSHLKKKWKSSFSR